MRRLLILQPSGTKHRTRFSNSSSTKSILCLLLLLICLLVDPVRAETMTKKQAMRELRLTNPSFSDKDLKSAYRKRSLETHPDKGGSSEEFIRVAEAYETLAGGSSGGGGRKKPPPSGGGGGRARSQEEKMREAEDMFFDMFDEFFDSFSPDPYIDMAFSHASNFRGKRFVKWTVKKIANFVVYAASKVMESDGMSINLNGKQFSGADFKKWREEKQRNKKRRERSSGNIPADLL